jgi:hypothetical protein
MSESLIEVLRPLSEAKAPPLADYMLNNREVALSAFKKYKRYVESWKPTTFTPEELKFLRGIPGLKPVTANVIYHGRNVPLNQLEGYEVGTRLLFDPPTQFSSWTTKKGQTDYFQRGAGYGIVLQAKTPPANKIFNVHSLMRDVLNRYSSWIENNIYNQEFSNADFKLLSFPADITLYDESELWVFGPIKAKVVSS